MSEQDGSSNSRTYRMRKRAEDVATTRQRIVDATVRLHQSVGPAATTISAIAGEAGVTRLTVYRHFPDNSALFAACSAEWAAQQRPPDAAAWSRVADPEQRLRAGLSDLYRFYHEGEPMLTSVRRDWPALPAELREQINGVDARHRAVLLKAFTARGVRRSRLRAVLGHAMSFWTWRSLCVDNGLSNHDAVEAMTALVMATADDSP